MPRNKLVLIASRFFIWLALLLTASALYADSVSLEAASMAARTQTKIIMQRFNDPNFALSHSYSLDNQPKPLYSKDGSELLAYVFELKPQGFIVIAANTDVVPVITYSEYGSFPWEENPNNVLLIMLRADIAERLRLTTPQSRARYNGQWNAILSGNPPSAPGDSWPPAGQTWTGGWVETQWHQMSPYYNKCPMDPVTSQRSVVGCVATAMVQIMNFWQYPDSVLFTSADNYTTDTRGINIDATTATLHSIDYDGGTPSAATCADISFAAGVSVHMDYTSEGSGAYHFVVPAAYKDKYAYSTADYKLVSDPDFFTVLEQNMKDSMPAMLGISGSLGGHSIVCDGFRETTGDDEWHLNYGWQSNPDPAASSWYVLPDELYTGLEILNDGIMNIEAPFRPLAVPVADFSGTPTSGSAPLSVTFTDLSTGDPTAWSWDFGDGVTSSIQNPVHAYTADGQYTVRLIVSNADGADTATKTNYISVGAGAPTANFTGTPTSGNAPLTVTFTDQSTGAPTGWLWSFGDGGTSTIQNPVHVYNNSGAYDVQLIAVNPSGSDTLIRTGYINVGTAPQPPVANFSGTPTTGNAPLSVTFTDQTSNSPSTWSWTFGDGSTSSDQNPVHVYNAAGSYTVRLIASNTAGADTLERANYIVVTTPGTPPVAAFTSTPDRAYVPLTHRLSVQFTDNSTGTPAPNAWLWTFGDNDTAITQNPTHVYTSTGSFIVRLIVTNTSGADTAFDTIVLAALPSDFFTMPALGSISLKQIEIGYGLPLDAVVQLTIYNVNGQLVKRFLSQEMPAGEHTLIWDLLDENGRAANPGVYFIELRAPEGLATSKIVLTR